ncbi:hypothetical protein [Neobacillus bataviensis]|uniref:hypothetical protein n=1 Tax=Neobacillus bataviensis TaxID=220685 RepID=UPI001CBD5C5D|nr:hypothetical protein [Neobacillus bataviensis]
MNVIKKIGLAIDIVFEKFTLLSLVALILVVTTQVMTRKLFNFVFFGQRKLRFYCLPGLLLWQ